ncbi:MAG: hypothetical protein MJA29_00430 [Candidatus Omnitrophica bacterium]|nr:hypothetical protein [Candidatus Omnitrophota bacterium]
MRKAGSIGIVAAALMLTAALPAQAADSKVVDVLAAIPQQNGLTVTVSRVVDGEWSEVDAVDFGTLAYDSINKVFGSEAYYAVDVGVNSNAPDWTVTHEVSSIANDDGSDNLDDNVNVSFIKQVDDDTGDVMDLVTFAQSHQMAYTREQLLGGWLRIYYGIATGDEAEDAPDAIPIDMDKPHGNYQGTITLILTP